MITGPLFKWFGSKWTASRHYPEPKFDAVAEPFAGSAGYALRHCTKDVTLAETDPHLFALWSWLINDATEAAIREIPLNVPEGTDIRSLGLDRGQELLMKTWQRTNNVGSCWTVSSWGNLPGQWTENTRARVAEEFHCVKHWKIVDDGNVLLAQDAVERTWFVDPPYLHNYSYKSIPLDYVELGRRILALRGQVIVCEAVCQKTGARPDWLPFVDFRKTVTSRRKTTNNHHSRELIYTGHE